MNTCKDSIFPVKTPEGIYECLTGDGEYEVNATKIEEEVVSSVGDDPDPMTSASSASLLTANGNAIFITIALLTARLARK